MAALIKSWFDIGKSAPEQANPPPEQINISITPSSFTFSKSSKTGLSHFSNPEFQPRKKPFTITVEARKEDNLHLQSASALKLDGLAASFDGLVFYDATVGEVVERNAVGVDESEWDVVRVESAGEVSKVVHVLGEHSMALEFHVGHNYKIGLVKGRGGEKGGVQYVVVTKAFFAVIE
ncbi:hypothetical protein TI39_contig63g00002 [Zymoseptoria brevis]|uniref:Uncharacterized protein n=1 Tax=Zymoseptoria brevis TaxID=1047168 RepID=A0A0F4GZ68_9PEZI|nr:hypothetical protein TI39_contig63g00002 [Zymoseptoria brevis]